MSITDLETYAGQVARLKQSYIRELGYQIRTHFEQFGTTVAVNYEPGNGTRYDLVLTPAPRLDQVGSERIPCGLREPDGSERPGWTVVSKLNGQTWSYPFDLTPGWIAVPGYVASHTSGNFADACALVALFHAIAREPPS